MSQPAIKVEDLSKKYLISHLNKVGNTSLVGSMAASVKNIFKNNGQLSVEEFWALNNVSFEIEKGDRVGIIGRNGAGKSTLLKILSRIVKPSAGQIEYEGRLTSLLEVGTGFHGDLTGRENIYLNGSILGMSKAEIDSKFDEIVAFSEVEQFLDTPVKRYSSGMYVRLAFAVAAHLDNDILVVDEVLAVGDAAFQEKCIGKISASQNEGKTVLFVSHNIGQISALCNKGIYLENGTLQHNGSAADAINLYINKNKAGNRAHVEFENKKTEYAIQSITLVNSQQQQVNSFKHDETYSIKVNVACTKKLNDVLLGISISDTQGKRVVSLNLPVSDKIGQGQTKEITAIMPAHYLVPREYLISVGLHIPNVQVIDEHVGTTSFTILDNGSEFYKYSGDFGFIFPKNEWRY